VGKLGTEGKPPGMACGSNVGMGGLLLAEAGVEGKDGKAGDGAVCTPLGGSGNDTVVCWNEGAVSIFNGSGAKSAFHSKLYIFAISFKY